MLIKEGLIYRFSHRSFQEYFAAWYTCKLVDDVQSKLLLSWIKESDSVFSDSYFTMLFDLQSEKVNKIVICPILKKVQKFYIQFGFSLEFLEILFEGIRLRKQFMHNNKVHYGSSLTIKNQYLCNGLLLNSRLNEFPYENYNENENRNIYNKLKEAYLSNSHEKNVYSFYMPFSQVLDVISERELLDYLSWFKKQIEYAIQIIEKYDDTNIGRKRKVTTILDEL